MTVPGSHSGPPASADLGAAVVAVLGSCATRDNFNSRFNPTYKRWYSCPLHQNQSSIIALMSEPIDVDWQPTRDMSDYDRWNVQTELSRSFLSAVVELQPDYLILDFFADVHFGCVQLDDGRFLTDNRWKVRDTDYYQQMQQEGRFRSVTLLSDTEEYLTLWRAAFDRFATFAATELPRTTLVVHRGANTDALALPDQPRPVSLQRRRRVVRLDVPKANELWAQLDDYAIAALGAECIDLTGTSYCTFDDHPWGPFYVHYTMDYYQQFLADLHRIHLLRTAGNDVSDRVTEIDAARIRRAATDAKQAAEIIARQRKRLEKMRLRIERLEAREAATIRSRLARRVPSFARLGR